MTVAELQTARGKVYTQYLAWIDAGCPESYSMDNRSVTKCDADFWLKQINQLDAAISAQSTGPFYAVQFRNPE